VFALLLALGVGQRHGYALISDVEQLTDGAIRLGPGTLYRSLQRMRVDGLIEELDDTDPVDDRRAERRRSYQITDAGRDAARAVLMGIQTPTATLLPAHDRLLRPRMRSAMERITGAVMVGLGVCLVIEPRF
jgi:DNA-binding PadR family transcriptional regulator